MTTADAQLADQVAEFYADPLGFVMFAYPWDTDPALQVVELPEPWASRFPNCTYGPDAWACGLLDEVGRQVRGNGFNGAASVPPIRVATSSGHGIGKSAMTGWLVNWILSTRPYAMGAVTANTSDQLRTKTFARIAEWTKRCITGHWFEVNTGKGNMSVQHRSYPESWRVDGMTCREENSEAFAGLHAAVSTPFYIFDEASAIPEPIWEVAKGGLTDGEPMMFVFGNPTRNTGSFFETFHRQRHRWTAYKVDSRSVQITNKAYLQELVDDYGEDSDIVRVRVKGEFPRAASMQLIPADIVEEAATRELAATADEVRIVGVDVARFGDDQSVIYTRLGRDGRQFPPQKYRELDTMQLAGKVAEWCNEIQPDALFIDGGGVGGGVVDRLRQLGYEPIEVQFGGKADNPQDFANKRAEMWVRMKHWLGHGAIPDDADLQDDLTSVEYGYQSENRLQLERKERMKERGLASPDVADALAITFAQEVRPARLVEDVPPKRRTHNRTAATYDPYHDI
jgi:hypothetical protein